ncbi:hypothetical protein BLD25_02275 [Candidatus Gracilibacteria bacterium GN02-872]|nr:hypothetical protein BLD25_02275 [Candidatus Gracilibacteria bacterium GN02-872]
MLGSVPIQGVRVPLRICSQILFFIKKFDNKKNIFIIPEPLQAFYQKGFEMFATKQTARTPNPGL